MNDIHIVSVVDDNFTQHLGVMMISLLENTNGSDVIFHVLNDGLSQTHEKKLNEIVYKYNARIKFYFIDRKDFQDFGLRDMSHVAYYKAIIPSVLDDSISQVIFLDCDVVVKDDIKKLWDKNIKYYHLAAVQDLGFDWYNLLGIPQNALCFNSGVMLINLEKWRNEGTTEKVLNFIKENSNRMKLHDQDAFNAVLYNSWYQLHPKWNQQSIFFKKKTNHGFHQADFNCSIAEPSIIHYTGISKPWHYFNNHPFKQEYHRYIKLSPWNDFSFYEEKLIKNKRLILFGAGSLGVEILNKCRKDSFSVDYFVDNDSNKWGTELEGLKIYSPKSLENESKNEVVVIISSSFHAEISRQLTLMGFKINENYIIGSGRRIPT